MGKKQKQSSLRIIGGSLGGRVIPVANSYGLRPTSARIRETLFNWLQHDLHNARCLDAFAGSGALGFEAVSRGAASVTFCEIDPIVARLLKKMISDFRVTNAQVCQSNGLSCINKEKTDILFLDPPYQHNLLPKAIDKVLEIDKKTQPRYIYLEHIAPIEDIVAPLLSQTYDLYRVKKAGDVYYGLLRHTELISSRVC